MTIVLAVLKLMIVQFLANFNCFLVLTFEIQLLLGLLNPYWKNLQNFFDIQYVIRI